jgi:hypothetical protein
VVAEAGAALGPELLDKAGGLEAVGSEGGLAEAVLHVVHQDVGGGDLQHKS